MTSSFILESTLLNSQRKPPITHVMSKSTLGDTSYINTKPFLKVINAIIA